MTNKGNLFIISAPSGAGKTSLVNALLERMPNVVVSISHTTRAMRPGEVYGKDYYFIAVDEFKNMLKRDEFLESAEVYGNFYATAQKSVTAQLEHGRDVILEIDWQGAEQVRNRIADTIAVFILPPSKHELERRLRGRGQDSDDIIARRMSAAKAEISHFDEFDYVILNDDFDTALQELMQLLSDPQNYQSVSKGKLQSLSAELLSNDG